MTSARPRRERKPMPPGREARPPRERKPMPPGREAPAAGAGRAAGDAAEGGTATERPPRAQPELAAPGAGRAIVAASWWGTALLVVTAVAGAIDPHPLDVAALVVAVAMFVGGIVAFFAAYVIAIGRSRESEIAIGAVFGLAGSAPRSVQARLYASLAVEIAVSVSTAAARPHSVLAFGILANMWGLGMIALWGARHGVFPPRKPPAVRRRGRR